MTLGCILLFGGLPQSPAVILYAAGIILVLCAGIVIALPGVWVQRAGLHGALIAGSLIFALPFIWLVGTSFKYADETFVSPPRWIPATVSPPVLSPYVARPLQQIESEPSGLSEQASDALWARCVGVIPPEELSRVDEGAARRAMVEALRGIPLDYIDRDSIDEAWSRVYRAVILGSITIGNAESQLFEAPAAAYTWTASGASRVATDAVSQTPILYDFSEGDTFSIRCVLDPDWVVSQCGEGQLHSIAVPMRQDRSWHRMTVTLAVDGKVYRSRDPLYLGDYRWRTVTFKRTDLDDRDERDMGIFPVELVEGESAAQGEISLTVEVSRNNALFATLAKYTQTYRDAWYADQNWPRYFLNSLMLVVLCIIGQLLACSMAAYAFSRLHWPGRDLVFAVLLSTMMLPAFVTMIPRFLIFKELGWYNTLYPLWVPAFFGTPFFIFLLRQFMLSLPRELEEAARIDGCSWFGIYGYVILPLMKPALAAVAVFTFIGTWNEFMDPLIYLSDERLYPLSLGLFNFRSAHSSEFGMLMAASTLMTLPVIALFFLCQRYFIQGVTLTGLKG